MRAMTKVEAGIVIVVTSLIGTAVIHTADQSIITLVVLLICAYLTFNLGENNGSVKTEEWRR